MEAIDGCINTWYTKIGYQNNFTGAKHYGNPTDLMN